MKKIIFFILLLFSTITFAQENSLTDEQMNSSGANKVEFADGNEEIRKLAKLDIENQIPFLLLKGGVNQMISSSDQKFEKKFKIYFLNYGCTAPTEKVESIYNQIIFDYLFSKYGKSWTKEIRKDIPGFKEFKKCH